MNTLQPGEWINNYADALYGYTLARVTDSGLAQDIVQDSFLSAWKAKDGFKGEASEKSWLFSILKHKIIDHYRKKARNILVPLEEAGNDDHFDGKGHWASGREPGDWDMENSSALDRKEFYTIFNGCKSKLQELQQAAFVMKYMEGLEAAEICKVLGITPSNYWVLIHRAKLQLRACLEKNWINPSNPSR